MLVIVHRSIDLVLVVCHVIVDLLQSPFDDTRAY